CGTDRLIGPDGRPSNRATTVRSIAAARAGWPCTTACSPTRITLPKAEIIEPPSQLPADVPRRAGQIRRAPAPAQERHRPHRVNHLLEQADRAVQAAGLVGAQDR